MLIRYIQYNFYNWSVETCIFLFNKNDGPQVTTLNFVVVSLSFAAVYWRTLCPQNRCLLCYFDCWSFPRGRILLPGKFIKRIPMNPVLFLSLCPHSGNAMPPWLCPPVSWFSLSLLLREAKWEGLTLNDATQYWGNCIEATNKGPRLLSSFCIALYFHSSTSSWPNLLLCLSCCPVECCSDRL